jgi:5-methylcytosine-specific restriction endonuclease McrA
MPRKPKKVYDSRWERVRRAVLDRDGHHCYVTGCVKPATHVDHIIPLAEGGRRLDPTNLRASCPEHNIGRVQRRAAELTRISRAVGTVRNW